MVWKEYETDGRYAVLTVVNTEIAAFWYVASSSQVEAASV
jgi:hypothetical protein